MIVLTRSSLFLLIAITAFAAQIQAQQAIFNVPTTDVLDKGKVYGELDMAFKPVDQDALDRFSSFVPRVVVGIGGNIEVGLNVAGNVQPGADMTVLVPTLKWKFYESDAKDVSLIAGTNFFIPVRNRTYNFGTYSYLAASKTIKKTRLTAGGYIASKNAFAAEGCPWRRTIRYRANVKQQGEAGGGLVYRPACRRLLHPRHYLQSPSESDDLLELLNW